MNEPLLPKTQPRRKSWSDFIKVIQQLLSSYEELSLNNCMYLRLYLKPSTFEMVLEYGSLTLAVILLYLVYYHPLEFHYHVAKGLLSSL